MLALFGSLACFVFALPGCIGIDLPDAATYGHAEGSGGLHDTGMDSTTDANVVDGTTGSTEACDPWIQDCSDTEKCVPFSKDMELGAHCVAVPDEPLQVGDPCLADLASDSDPCGFGAICIPLSFVDDSGRCIPLCTGTPEVPVCEDPQTACVITGNGFFTVCSDVCHPLAPECLPGHGCYPLADVFICSAHFGGGYGTECDHHIACEAGLLCGPADAVPGCAGAGCCTTICDLDNPDASPCPDAAEGQTCLPWYEEGLAPLGYESVGACGLP